MFVNLSYCSSARLPLPAIILADVLLCFSAFSTRRYRDITQKYVSIDHKA